MTNWFASPAALWLGLLIGPLLLLYMLRHKPVRKRVASVVLWVGVAKAQVATSPFQRLQKSLSLLFMVLGLVALVLALAGLRIPGGEQRGVPVTIIVDVTASMSTFEKGGDRIGVATERARDAIDAAGNSPFSMFSWDGNLHALTSADVDAPAAKSSLDDLSSVEYGASDAALVRALEQLTSGENRRVILVSDHAPGDLAGAYFVQAGTPKLNAGIVTASLSELAADKTELFFAIDLRGAEKPLRVPLVLERSNLDGTTELIDARDVTLQPDTRTPVNFTDVQPGLYSLRLKLDDGLALDNIAWLRFSELPVQDVVITGSAPPSLMKAMQAIQDAMGTINLVQPGSEDEQTVTYVFASAASSGAEPRLPAAFLAPDAAPRDVTVGETLEVPGAATRPTSNALWRGAGTPDIRIPNIFRIETGRQSKPVLEAGAGSAISLLPRQNALQDLLIAFPMDETANGFTGKFAFVIFWANWFDYVRRVREPLPRGSVSTRQTVEVRELEGRGDFRYAAVGSEDFTSGTPGLAIHFDSTGAYVLQNMTDTDLPMLGVSLLDASESNLELTESAPYDLVALETWMQEFEGEGERRDLELRPWLGLLALALLLFDWFWFRRRFPTRVVESPRSPKTQTAVRVAGRAKPQSSSQARA